MDEGATAGSRLERLKVTISWARENSDFYRTYLAGVQLDVDREEQLLEQIPIIERDHVQAISRDPAGPLACVDPDAFVRFHHTSGSSGDGSLWVFDTAQDWEGIVRCWSVALERYGVGKQDRALVCAGYGRFIGFWGLHDALVAGGVLTVSGADADTKARVALIDALGITVVATTPTYAMRLGSELSAQGVGDSVRLLITSGEPRPVETRRKIEALWDCVALDTAGMTEAGTISMYECPSRPGRMHVMDDLFLEEVLDPKERTPVGYGEIGVRVVTTLNRRGMPFIRYWTNDLVIRQLSECDCDAGEHVYAGGIKGRLDHMVKIDGVWFLPSMLESVVRKFDCVVEHRATLTTDDNRNFLLVELDIDPGAEPRKNFTADFAAECKRALGFRPRVDLVGGLPQFEAKAKRFYDARESVAA